MQNENIQILAKKKKKSSLTVLTDEQDFAEILEAELLKLLHKS